MKKKTKGTPVISREMHERPKDKLPIKTSEYTSDIDIWKNHLLGILKKQIVQVVTGAPNDFDVQLTQFVKGVWNNGYDTGLAHMDKMHSKIDNELTNGENKTVVTGGPGQVANSKQSKSA